MTGQIGIDVSNSHGFENGKSVNVSLHVLLSLMRAVGQLEQIELILPELLQNAKDVIEKKVAPKRIRHGKQYGCNMALGQGVGWCVDK